MKKQVIAVVLIVLMLAIAFVSLQRQKTQVIEIDADCKECTKANAIATMVLDASLLQNSSFTSLNESDKQAKELVSKYGIELLPAVIVKGREFAASSKAKALTDTIARKSENDVIVIQKPQPPFKKVKEGKIIGIVDYINLVDESCSICQKQASKQALENLGFVAGNETVVDIASELGQELKAKYSIRRVPTAILSKDISYYKNAQKLTQIGTFENDGSFVLRIPTVPYRNLDYWNIVGGINITIIDDLNCANCTKARDIALKLREIFKLNLLGIQTLKLQDNYTQKFLKYYDIHDLPVVAIAGDFQAYKDLERLWKASAGTRNDNLLVFRNFKALASKKLGFPIVTYKSLLYNETFTEVAK